MIILNVIIVERYWWRESRWFRSAEYYLLLREGSKRTHSCIFVGSSIIGKYIFTMSDQTHTESSISISYLAWYFISCLLFISNYNSYMLYVGCRVFWSWSSGYVFDEVSRIIAMYSLCLHIWCGWYGRKGPFHSILAICIWFIFMQVLMIYSLYIIKYCCMW